MPAPPDAAARRAELLAGLPSPVPEEGAYGRLVARQSSNRSRSGSSGLLGASKSAVLSAAVVALIFFRSVDQVIFYRINFMYAYYVFVLSAIILPSAFILVSIPVVCYKLYCTDDITPAMRAFPSWKFAVMGLLDALFNILSTLPVQHIGGSMANVLSQTVLPINMLLAYAFLGTRYKNCHYLGALLVVYGVLVKMMPVLFNLDGEGGGSMGGGVGWICLLVFSQFFSAGSNVFKEIGLKGVDMDEWYMNLWVALWQMFFGALCFWQGYVGAFTDPLPAVGACEGCTWSAMFKGSNACFWGGTVDIAGPASSPTFDDATCTQLGGTFFPPNDGAGVPPGDSCCRKDCETEFGTPSSVFGTFLVFNVTFNMLMLFVFKHGSSVLFVVANAARLPLVQCLLMWKWLAGPSDQKFAVYDGYALFALVLAVVVYYSEKEDKMPDAADSASVLSAGVDDVPVGCLGHSKASFARASFCDVPGRSASESAGSGGPLGLGGWRPNPLLERVGRGRGGSSASFNGFDRGDSRTRYSFSSFRSGTPRRRAGSASSWGRAGVGGRSTSDGASR
jgi:hypothetical protein